MENEEFGLIDAPELPSGLTSHRRKKNQNIKSKQAKQIRSNLEKLKYCRMMILFDGEERDKMINSN